MDTFESLNHSVWQCKYHVVFIPKCRRKTLYAELRQYLGEVFRKLALQKESRIEEGHLLSDHVHIRGRARFTWRGSMESGSATSSGSISGRAATSCPRLVGMRQ